MSKLTVPEGYKTLLSPYETQSAIGMTKRFFEDVLCEKLNLKRVSAPLFVEPESGLNDNLNGVERPVDFDLAETGRRAEVVHSLAKWKRMALKKYGFHPGEGLYTDMNAIRRDEELDNLHSVYVDQWDWEKIITPEERNRAYLMETAGKIIEAIADTSDMLRQHFPQVGRCIKREAAFVTTQQLEDMYPSLTPKQREDAFLRENGTAFIMQIGKTLRSGKKHDGRAPDYDDWELNGDIMFWDDILGSAIELSSMGIRVDPAAMDRQLAAAGCDDRRSLPFHRDLLAGRLPLTIGGGIGQSRLCMLLLNKAHIGEVQVSVWDEATLRGCADAGIELL